MNIKIIIISIGIMLITSVYISAQDEYNQRDLTNYVAHVAGQSNKDYFSDHDHELWHYYLNRSHPNISTINTYFEEAAAEFGVPADLLKVIGQIENNWTQIGPSIDRGWGIMHLVENPYCNTLGEAATLIRVSKDVLKDDARQNIRGAAALLAQYYNDIGKGKSEWEKWFEAAKKFSGLINERLQVQQATRYFNTLKNGISSTTVWSETITIAPKADLQIPESQVEKTMASADYPPAISDLTPCNFGVGRNSAINTWVNHWIAVGTYAGTISWFHTCRPSAPSSAHFVIRNSDGEITQVVGVANTAYHAGASGQNNNGPSIGIEHEATIANPSQWSSVPMLTASTDMACYFLGIYNIPATRSLPGIREHNEMPGTNTSCAGNIPWTTWMNMLNACLNNTSCPPNQTITTNSTGTIIVGDYIISSGGVTNGNSAVYDAGTYVELIPGFEGQAGCVFEGKIGGCTVLLTNPDNQLNAMENEELLNNTSQLETKQQN